MYRQIAVIASIFCGLMWRKQDWSLLDYKDWMGIGKKIAEIFKHQSSKTHIRSRNYIQI